LPIEILETKNTVQVVPQKLKKVKLIKDLIHVTRQYLDEYYNQNHEIDFALYIGTDQLSEEVFRYLNSIEKKFKKIKKLKWQIKIGKNVNL